MKFLQRNSRFARLEILTRERSQTALINVCQAFALRTKRLIHSASHFRDFLQRRFVQMRLHRFAVFVFREMGLAVFARHWDDFAGCATNTNHENLHTVFRGGFRGSSCLAAEIFAVRDENENFIRRRARLENRFGFVNGGGDIGPAARNHIYIEHVERFAKRVVIECDWTLQKRTAGERNQTDAIAVEFRDQISDGEPCAREPVRLHILRQHAFRSVDREKQFESFPMCLLKFEAGLWSREGNKSEGDSEYEEHTFREPTRTRNRRSKFRQ